MSTDKFFLTYNQQMRKLRKDKKIDCNGSNHKKILIRAGYFNIINGYKTPFTSGVDRSGNHIYLPDTSIDQIYKVKQFDDSLRLLLLKYITQIEEEVRTLTGYKFDQCNNDGKIPWYDTNAYSPSSSLQNRMNAISCAYSELSHSQLDYVKFYMNNHEQIPTWIMLKVVNFSTFINILNFSKQDVTHSICKLYHIFDANGLPSVKLLIGSLHWLRKVRNSCAHNERIYCISQAANSRINHSGRIKDTYILSMRPAYHRDSEKKIFDLLVYFKYYLPNNEYRSMMSDLQKMLTDLQQSISNNAFENIRGKIGIKDLADLETLKNLPKSTINYNKFDSI